MTGKLGRWVLGLTLLLGTIAAVVVVVSTGDGEPAPGGPPRVAAEDGLRTLVVSDARSAAASAPGGLLQAFLVRGRAVAGTTVATVLSDEQCEPDAQGFSHCLNELEMPGGDIVAVRHVHRMAEVPCLYPGERVHVRFA